MSVTRKGKKANEAVDFETFVRESLSQIRQDVEEIKDGQAKLHGELKTLEGKVPKNDEAIFGLKKLYDSLQLKYDKLAGEVFEKY